jgi:hypothetical protein
LAQEVLVEVPPVAPEPLPLLDQTQFFQLLPLLVVVVEGVIALSPRGQQAAQAVVQREARGA